MEKSIAIITARGGSKRIPHKNIKEFCGRPIIAYSIEAAIQSKVFDEIMVSTDDSVIAEIAVKEGAKVPFFRSDENSNDYASTADVITEVLEGYKKMGREFEYVCCMYPTAPFIKAEELAEALTMLEKNRNVHTVIPVVPFSFPPQRAFVLRDEMIQYQYPENRTKRSQDLEKIYHDCGQYYMLRTTEFCNTGEMIGKAVLPIVKDELQVQDIDNEIDWKMAEVKYKLQKEDGNLC